MSKQSLTAYGGAPFAQGSLWKAKLSSIVKFTSQVKSAPPIFIFVTQGNQFFGNKGTFVTMKVMGLSIKVGAIEAKFPFQMLKSGV